MSLSLLTIVRGRQTHLANQFRGLCQSTMSPTEWIIVGMDQDVDVSEFRQTKFPIVTARVDGDGKRLPLAEARNQAAELSRGDTLIFLDVDCIPSAHMIERFAEVTQTHARLWMGSPRYLPEGVTKGNWDLVELDRIAVQHPLQPCLQENEQLVSSRYELFWSLCFAIRKDDFERLGKFDEQYRGYGGEDTDFAFSARRIGLPFAFVDAVAFHQYHAVYKPPMNHLVDVVSNARRFRQKWGVWPMESWLSAFANEGLVRFDPINDQLELLRKPTSDQIEQSLTRTPAGF
ncbi:galactosyltransferase-related protein [Roseiconus lacunae]|uniref:glycosyltransferase family 2 protein n=1 Tax=Roseiconus lacunae TaxID=2605694 RepID=UPI00308F6222|nr:galactosyltransferase-related protein [Stieleria sp. HD01]